MDNGRKTVAELAEEAKEKRYVTLDVGAKLSGYTKDYLEHLCRINRVDFRLWNNGQFVIELDSLLSETHTILLSYEGINFVDKNELEDPTPQIVTSILTSRESPTRSGAIASEASLEMQEKLKQKVADGITQSIPTFGDVQREAGNDVGAPSISFVGNSVISAPTHPTEQANPGFQSVPGRDIEIDPVRPVISKIPTRASIVEASRAEQAIESSNPGIAPASAPVTILPEKKGTPIHLRVLGESEEQIAPPPPKVVHLGIAPDTKEEPKPVATPSAHIKTPELHPIRTSLDAREHHDPAPLFPLVEAILDNSTPPPPKPPSVASDADRKVVVFSERAGVAKQPVASIAEKPVVTPSIPETHAVDTPREVAMTAHPSLLPMKEDQHALIVREPYSLAKSPMLNLAFIACLALAGLSVARVYEGRTPEAQISAVVSALPSVVEPDALPPTPPEIGTTSTEYVLPFSDDVVISTSTEPNTIVVQGVFGGKPGAPVEFVISPK